MRAITDHIVNPVNDRLAITVVDERGPAGANYVYVIAGSDDGDVTTIQFQKGPIEEAGVNGVTHEALIAIVVDRLRGFQNGAFACRENALAITKLEEAMHWLHARTLSRMRRGVEGTSSI
jgi:hypothetical protein